MIIELYTLRLNLIEVEKIKRICLSKNKENASVISNDMTNILNHEIRKNSVVWINEDKDLHWMYSRLANVAMNLNNQFFNFDLFGFSPYSTNL